MPRRKPFSNKQKKQQLQQKRERRREKGKNRNEIPNQSFYYAIGDKFGWSEEKNEDDEEQPKSSGSADAPIGEQESVAGPLDTKKSTKYDPGRFRMDFEKETKKELDRRRHLAKTEPVSPVLEVRENSGLSWVVCSSECT